MARKLVLAAVVAGIGLPGAALADGPLPTDPNVVAGDITISNPTDFGLLVQQGGAAGIVDWGSFSIANGYGVQFQNGDGATLNRVTGGDLSQIMGTLDATGSVYLVNQNGIVFGKTGIVNTGGSFVAATLDIGNADFLDGGDKVFAGDAASYVINLGSISAMGGDVALLARNVVNEGSISAPNGTVGLVAGREILMRDASVDDGQFAVRIGGADTLVSDSGKIRAAAAELRANGGNVYALAGNTEGTIVATGVARVKGRVFLTAGDGGAVKVDKAVKAVAQDGAGGAIAVTGGAIDLGGVLDVSGTAGGVVQVKAVTATDFSGAILAYGSGVAGPGGFAEVSGAHLRFGGTVDTGGGTLLIDPNNIEITNSITIPSLDGATQFTPGNIVALLRTNNVILESAGSDGEAGTILITDGVLYDSAFNLSLLAQGDIVVNASIQNANATSGDVTLVAGWDGLTGGAVFDPSVFDAADLASQTLFGTASGASYSIFSTTTQASGSVFIGDGNQFRSISVGARSGATRVYANDLVLQGSSNADGFGGFAQLGYHVASGGATFDVNGAISVRATGDVSLLAGSADRSAAQIGHVGLNEGAVFNSANAVANLSVEALGNMTLQGGTGAVDYAMLGNGSLDFSGLHTSGQLGGSITVKLGGELTLQDGPFVPDTAAWIGHGSTVFNTISASDISLTAAAFDRSSDVLVGSGGSGTLDMLMIATDLEAGSFKAIATNSSLILTGIAAPLFCECSAVTTTTDLVIQASGDIVLNGGFAFQNAGSGAIVLAAGGNFLNRAGATALTGGGGRWLVYSTRPDQNAGDFTVLAADFLSYGTTYDPVNPVSGALPAGNGFAYAVTPIVSVGPATMTYGGAFVAPAVTVAVGGVDVAADGFGLTLSAARIDPAQVVLSGSGFVNAGSYAAGLTADVTAATAAAVSGVTLTAGQLTVDRAVLSAVISGTPTRVYDGTTGAVLTAGDFTLSGFVTGEDGTVTQSLGTYAGANAATSVGVSATLAAVNFAATPGTALANYVLPTLAAGFGAIDQAVLTAVISGNPTRVYDATFGAVLTAGDFTLNGFVTGEGASVTQTVGTYGSANAGVGIGVTTTLAAGSFAANSGTSLANYVLPVAAAGLGTIDRAVLTAVISGTPTRVYDGTTSAVLTAGDFTLSGFVTGQGASVTQTTGTYGSPNAGAGVAVSAALAAGNLSANAGTLLANYLLPVSASGFGAIDRATLTAVIIGNPTKPFDGSTSAILTAADFLLSGFVTGEGATVSQTNGIYGSPTSGTGIGVTAMLAAGDFAANSGTLLANYILPVSASGTGSIGVQPPVSLIPVTRGLDPFDTTPLGQPTGPADQIEVVNTETTQQIIDEIKAGVAFCKQLVHQEYAVDCLSDRLQSVADGLSSVGEYSEVRAALEDAAQKLHALAVANASTVLGQTVARGPGSRRSSRPLTAVTASANVNAQAAAIINSTELVLLRSSAGSERRRVAFEQISAVVDSTKVLLRST